MIEWTMSTGNEASRAPDALTDDVAALTQLFERIADPDVRRSILLLVDALVASTDGAMPVQS